MAEFAFPSQARASSTLPLPPLPSEPIEDEVVSDADLVVWDWESLLCYVV